MRLGDDSDQRVERDNRDIENADLSRRLRLQRARAKKYGAGEFANEDPEVLEGLSEAR